MEPRFLSVADVLGFHEDQLANYGGAPGVRDMGLLESAVAMPMAGFGDQYLHADLFEMAAAYLYHIVCNHPFVDGNKRTGAAGESNPKPAILLCRPGIAVFEGCRHGRA